MSEAPAHRDNSTPSIDKNSALTKGPGELGVHLSHLKSRLRALAADETLPDGIRQELHKYYRHESDRVQTEITLLSQAQTVRRREEEAKAAAEAVEFAASEAGRKRARELWQKRGTGMVLGSRTRTAYELAQFPDNPEEHELSLARSREIEARRVLADARLKMEATSATLASLRLDDAKWGDTKAEADRWELGQRWEVVTPDELRPAVRAIRKVFKDRCWEFQRSTMMLCYAALHPGERDHSSEKELDPYRHFLTSALGASFMQSVSGDGEPPSHVFKAFIDAYEAGLKAVARFAFRELFDIGKARTTMLASHPADWAKKQVGFLISDEKATVRYWIKNVCDKQVLHSAGFDDDEDIYWGSWRAPKFIHMQPAGNTPYTVGGAWEREELANSERLLEARAEHFITFLMLDLDRTTGTAHVELAKQPSTPLFSMKDVTPPAPGVPLDGLKQDQPPQTAARQERRQAVIKKVRNPETFTVLTTGEAALYFEVNPRTVYRWLDDGKLRRGPRRGTITIESILRLEKARSRKRPSR